MKVTEKHLILAIHNVRSCHNVGSMFRTSDGLGVEEILLIGYTPYPISKADPRLPHEAQKINAAITKTALGAENTVKWQHFDTFEDACRYLHSKKFKIFALEQTITSVKLPDFQVPEKCALIVGNEVDGLPSEVLTIVDDVIEIPMQGTKESYNVAVASAIGLYHCRFS